MHWTSCPRNRSPIPVGSLRAALTWRSGPSFSGNQRTQSDDEWQPGCESFTVWQQIVPS